MLKKEDNFVLTNEFPIKLEVCSLTQNWGSFHVTFQGPSMSTKIMTTGYSETITHSEADGAAA